MAAPGNALHPEGSQHIAKWAAMHALGYEWHPREDWFRRWEPYDTLAPPSHYYNACTRMANPGHIVLVEPWYADEDGEPLERTILAFASHPGLVRRAAMRAGEHFLTRVAFLESPPPPTVQIGDRLWDAHVVTRAASALEASTAFHPGLRKLLARWGFQGHIELRAGGLVIHQAGLRPLPDHYERLMRIVRELVMTAISYPR